MTGTGTELDPFIIYNHTDFNNIRNNMSQSTYYELSDDIDLSSYDSWTPIGSPVVPFESHLNGKGFTISNMTITSASPHHAEYGSCVGLFGYARVQYTGSYIIKNLNIHTASINLNNWNILNTGSNVNFNSLYVGILLGYCNDDVSYPISVPISIENIIIDNASINVNKSNISGYTNIYSSNISGSEMLGYISIAGINGNSYNGTIHITSCSINDLHITGITSRSGELNCDVSGLSNYNCLLTYNRVMNSYINFEIVISDDGENYTTQSQYLYISGLSNQGSDILVHDNYVYNTIISGTTNVCGLCKYIYVYDNSYEFGSGPEYSFPSGRNYISVTFGNSPTESVYEFCGQYGELGDSSSLYNYYETSSITYPNLPYGQMVSQT